MALVPPALVDDKSPESKDARGEPKASDLVADAETSGKLAPLEEVLTEFGWDTPAGEMLLLAQKDERTRGKSPEELAGMLREDGALYDDLEAYKPGGKLENLGKSDEPADDAPSAEDDAEMDDFMGASENLKGGDKKKAFGAMKDAGAKKPKDLDGDVDKKTDFLKRMAE